MILAAVQPGPPTNVAEVACQTVLLVAGVVALVWQWRTRREAPTGIEAWRAEWLDFGIWLFVIYCAAFIGINLLRFIAGNAGDNPADEFGLMLRAIALHSATLAAQVAMLGLKRSWSPWPVSKVRLSAGRILKLALPVWLAAFPLIIIASQVWSWILQLVQTLSPRISTPVQHAVQILDHTRDPGHLAALIIFAVVIAPINEELFFRAGLYRFLKSQIPVRYAVIAVNLLFALAHANLLTFLPLFVLGLLLTRSYERSGNVAVPIVFHALFNLTNVAMILFFPDTATSLN